MKVFVFLVSLFLNLTLVYSQSKTGTTIGQFLLIEPSARALGMGNASVTLHGDPSAGYFNPAAPAWAPRTAVQFSHGAWLVGISHQYATADIRMGKVDALSIHVTSLNSGDIAVRTVEQPLGTGEQYQVRDLAMSVGYSRKLSDRFSAGVNLKYVTERIWNSSLQAGALDFGVMYQLPFGAQLGASLSNFGTKGKFDGKDLRVRFDANPDKYGDNSSLPAALVTDAHQLPVLFRVGMDYPVQLGRKAKAVLAINAFHPSDNTESVSLGTEITLFDTFSLRGGYQHLFQQDHETGLTLGAGINYEIEQYRFRFDYGWADFGRLGSSQRFGFAFDF
ncbi:MAG TPA: PorV/PorQ family protein [Rhodothermales bacterium]|nr:PorV/PorQ family protein [Rhodothermales bacterium]HRR09798.1 PorV/PorQ family protein [Rhodothermales bacterium]